jgi:hypothetical protein
MRLEFIPQDGLIESENFFSRMPDKTIFAPNHAPFCYEIFWGAIESKEMKG